MVEVGFGVQQCYVVEVDFVGMGVVCQYFQCGVVFLCGCVVGVFVVGYCFYLVMCLLVEIVVGLLCVGGSYVVLDDGGWLVGWCICVVFVEGDGFGVVFQCC